MKKIARIISVTFVILVTMYNITEASYIRNYPVKVTQPNGSVLNCFASGDEYHNWLHDADNYTIIMNPHTGYWCYAVKNAEQLIASSYIAGTVYPSSVGLTKGINLSEKQILARKQAILANTPNKITLKKGNSKSTGTLNNLVIFIRFSDENEFTDNINFYTDIFNANSGNSMKNYYEEVSYNKLNINTSFYPETANSILSYQDYYPRSYYKPYDYNLNPDGYFSNNERANREQSLLANAVNAVKSQIPSSLNLDYNNDGYVDNICFIISGSFTAWSELLWPHRWVLYTQNVDINGLLVYDYNFQLQSYLKDPTTGVGVLCHEMFHTLGAPDLYHYTADGIDAVGNWDLMDMDSNPPQSMGAYMKYRYGGWIDSLPLISAPGRYSLNPLTSSTNNCFKIMPNLSDEYFVVEYRKKQGVFESSINASGLLVYRINSLYDGQGNSQFDGLSKLDEIYLYRPEGNLYSNGNWVNANFCSNSGRNSINDITNPSAFLSDGSAGGLNISSISEAGNTISFDLNGGEPKFVDVSIDSLVSPQGGCGMTSTQKITVKIKNNATAAISSGIIIGYKINDNKAITETYSGSPIPSNASRYYTFKQTADLSVKQTYTISVFSSVSGDINAYNDTLRTSFTNGHLGYRVMNVVNFSDTYYDLNNNGTVINVSNYDDSNSDPLDIGFNFNYNCSSFNKFILNTNGFIKLGDTPPSRSDLFFSSDQTANQGIFNSNNIADNNILSALNLDLIAGNSSPEFRVYTSGYSPNRVCTIQFKNMKDKALLSANQYKNINFQIKLYETTNKIEFIYGSWEASGSVSAYKTSAIGLKGSGNTVNQLLVARKSSSIDWSATIFDNVNYNLTSSFNFGNPPERPAPDFGRTFQFNADEQNTPSVITGEATDISDTSATLNGRIYPNGATSQAVFEWGLTKDYGNVVAAQPQFVSGTSEASVSSVINGLTPNSIYHYRLKAENSAGINLANDIVFSTYWININQTAQAANNIKIYPNPVLNQLNIEVSNSAAIQKYEIYSLLGKLISTSSFYRTTSLDMTNFPNDVYILKLYSADKIIVKKITK